MKLTTEVRQKQIIESSMEIIRLGGIQNLTIREISRKIGISEQAIYRHFKNKLAILLSIIEYFNENLKNSFNSTDKSLSSIDKILNITTAHLEYLQNNPSTAAIIFAEEIFRNESVLVKEVNRSLNKRIEHMTELLQLAREKKEIKKTIVPENMAIVFLGSLRLLVNTWRMSEFSFDLVDKGKKVINDLVKLIKI